MNLIRTMTVVLLFIAAAPSDSIVAAEELAAPTGSELREVIVSHADKHGILQLYRMKEDGSDRLQLTHSKQGCRMPACSPDSKKLLYVEQVDRGMGLWVSALEGRNARCLVEEGVNLVPSWLPDSQHVVWSTHQLGLDVTIYSRIHLLDIILWTVGMCGLLQVMERADERSVVGMIPPGPRMDS